MQRLKPSFLDDIITIIKQFRTALQYYNLYNNKDVVGAVLSLYK